MIQALGKIVRLREGHPLSKHDFSLPLSDILLNLVERDIHGPSALSFSQHANSFAHDFIHLATLAGQLLWYVSVAPVRTGTPDSLRISLTAESYFVCLRSAYDIIAAIIVDTCVDPKKRGQVPGDSFHRLIEWAKANPARVQDDLRFLTAPRDSFMELRGIRDKLIHSGYDLLVYTDDIAPSFGMMDTGEVDLHFLRSPGEPLKNKVQIAPLMPFLQKHTKEVLSLADQVANVISGQQGHTASQTHVLNGVYIPALNHILLYEEPIRREMTAEEKSRRKIKAWYLYKAGDYLESLNFGFPDSFWLRFTVRVSELFGEKPPLYVSKPEYPRYRDSEILIGWKLIFSYGDKHFGLFVRDAVGLDGEEPAKLKVQLDEFKARFELEAAAIILNSDLPPEYQLADFVGDSDPISAAQTVFNLLTNSR
jgi:hypothetical protein